MSPQHASRKNGIELSAKNQVETFNERLYIFSSSLLFF